MSLPVLWKAQALSLEAAGFPKPLRLTWLRRRGALEIFAVEGEALEAVRFAPTGVVRDQGGRLVPTPEAAEPYAEAMEAFAALGRRLQSLQPRAAATLFDVVRTAQGCFWLRAAAGLTLEDWLAENPGPVDPVIVAAFARRLGGALAELHAGGVTHGDLSPGGIVIEDEGVKLVGFGVDRRPFFHILRSQEGLVEPGYAPPEAHDGARRRPIGPAADLYAASAVLLRLLTGHSPRAANAAARLAGEDLWRGAPPEQAGPLKGVEAGLALVPEERPTSAAAWLAGLELGPETGGDPWFAGVARIPPPADEPFVIPPPPAPLDAEPAAQDEAPLAFDRAERPSRNRARSRALAAACLVALTGASAVAAVVWLAPPQRTAPVAALKPAPKPPPAAPVGCQWSGASDAWRLRCADEPIGLRLPERFDAGTTTRAGAGDVAAMERLGAFYRQRAITAAPANRSAYAYQAYAWLGRAADAPAKGRPEDQRARDDAALALGRMLGRGEGGRAIDAAGAESRLRQAAAGSRADAVLALAQQLEAAGDAERVVEARGLYARVAQLKDGSTLQREAAAALARIDAARAAVATPPPESAPEPPPTPKPPEPITKPAPPRPARTPAKPPAALRPSAAPPPAPRRSTPTPPPRTATGTPFGARTWTSFTFLQVDPAANFYPQVELAGRAACAREGGYALSVRNGDVTCPNGVNYCQVRAIATCQSE